MHHHWQDFVIAGSTLVFNVALVPSIISKSKPALSTSLITVTFLIVVTIMYATLALWFSVVMQFINTALWATLGVQKLKQYRR